MAVGPPIQCTRLKLSPIQINQNFYPSSFQPSRFALASTYLIRSFLSCHVITTGSFLRVLVVVMCVYSPRRRILIKVMDAPNVGTATLIGQIELTLKEMIPKKRRDAVPTLKDGLASPGSGLRTARPSLGGSELLSVTTPKSGGTSPAGGGASGGVTPRSKSPQQSTSMFSGLSSINQRAASPTPRASGVDSTMGGLLTMGNALGKDLSALSNKERDDIKDNTRRYALERPNVPKPTGPQTGPPPFGIVCFYKAKVFSRLAELPLLAMNAGIERRTVKVPKAPINPATGTATPRDEKLLLLPLLATIKRGVGIYTVARMASRRIKNSILLAEQRTLLASRNGRASMDLTAGVAGTSGGLGTIKGGTFTPPRSPLGSVRGLATTGSGGIGSGKQIGLGSLTGINSTASAASAGSASSGASSGGAGASGGVSGGAGGTATIPNAAAMLKGMGASTQRLTASGHDRGASGKLDAAAIAGLMKTFSGKTKTSSQSTANPAGNTLLDDVMKRWDEHEKKQNALPGGSNLWKRSTLNADGTKTPTHNRTRSHHHRASSRAVSPSAPVSAGAGDTKSAPNSGGLGSLKGSDFGSLKARDSGGSTGSVASTGSAAAPIAPPDVPSPANKRKPLRDMIRRVMKKNANDKSSNGSAPTTPTSRAIIAAATTPRASSPAPAIPSPTQPPATAIRASPAAAPTTPKRS